MFVADILAADDGPDANDTVFGNTPELFDDCCEGEPKTVFELSSLTTILGDSVVGRPCGDVADVIVVLLLVDLIDTALFELLFLEGLGEFDFSEVEEFVIKFFELCSDPVLDVEDDGDEDLFSLLSFSFLSPFLVVDWPLFRVNLFLNPFIIFDMSNGNLPYLFIWFKMVV